MPILNALLMKNQCYLNVRSKCILNALRIRKGGHLNLLLYGFSYNKRSREKYPQIDYEATGLDFGLCRFRNCLVGAPHTVSAVTAHKPLCSIFNGNRRGSIHQNGASRY